MAPRRPKRPHDPNQLEKLIVDLSVGDAVEKAEAPLSDFAREGGLKGGRARAKSLSAEQRKAIAQEAAKQRWNRQKEPVD